MKHVGPVRRQLGFRTVFNLLGPLCNPAGVRRQLLGVFSKDWTTPLARVLDALGTEKAWVVHGASGWDEATPIGPFLVYDVSEGAIERREVDPQRFGIERCEASALAGADAAANLTALRRVFEGNDRGAHLSALLLQAGMALTIAGRATSIDAGMALARTAIESGAASAWLRRLQQFASGLKRPGAS